MLVTSKYTILNDNHCQISQIPAFRKIWQICMLAPPEKVIISCESCMLCHWNLHKLFLFFSLENFQIVVLKMLQITAEIRMMILLGLGVRSTPWTRISGTWLVIFPCVQVRNNWEFTDSGSDFCT